jgi:nicotinamide mononucleotide transporter
MNRNPQRETRNKYRMDQIIKWLSGNYIELLGAILGIAYIFFSIKQSILTWPIGLATSALYVVVFFVSKLYADMGLQMYYVAISIYGWYEWLRGSQTTHSDPVEVCHISRKLASILSVVSLLLFLLIWMLARKVLEHWLVWIFVDAFSAGLFAYKQLYPTVILFVVYTVMAYIGYREWKRDLRSKETTATMK